MEALLLVSPTATPLVIDITLATGAAQRPSRPVKHVGRGTSAFTIEVGERKWKLDRHVLHDRKNNQVRFSNLHVNGRAVFTNEPSAITAYGEPLLRCAAIKSWTRLEFPQQIERARRESQANAAITQRQREEQELQLYVARLLTTIPSGLCPHNYLHVYTFPTTVERPDGKSDSDIYFNV